MSKQTQRVCIVGPSTHFLSGITYHTYSLCNAMDGTFTMSAILMRRLLPRFLYPGKKRVGADISNLTLPASVPRVEGVDWYWIPTLARAVWFLLRRRPETLILQWWTGTVLHTYLALALVARLLGADVVVEFHEVLDTGEARMAWASRYVALVAPWLLRLASGYTVHSEYDRQLVRQRYGLAHLPSEIVPVGSYDNFRKGQRRRAAPDKCCNLLYFGVIRQYKGLDDLIRAFDAIPADEIGRFWLTIVGETWEGWTVPNDLIAHSRYRDRITFVNRYVRDDEVEAFFGGADVVVLPYRRASQSGPLHVALNYGLPVVVTSVGGLVEAIAGYRYPGAVFAEPDNRPALLTAIRKAADLRGAHFGELPGWAVAAERYRDFLPRLRQARVEHGGATNPAQTVHERFTS